MSIVTVKKDRYEAEALYQWDVNQTLQVFGLSLASVPEVHFTHGGMGAAIVRQASMDASGVVSVQIPNSLLQKGYMITAFICGYTGGTFETLYKIDIPVKPRPRPADYVLINDEEVYSFEAMHNAVVNVLKRLDEFEGEFAKTIKTTQAIADDVRDNKHASNHAKNGIDPIKPSDIGAAEANSNLTEFVNGVLKTLSGAGVPVGRIMTGTYPGNGTYGVSNKIKLSFDFEPKLVIVQPVDDNDDTDEPITLILVSPATIVAGYFSEGVTTHVATWSGNSVEWYIKRWYSVGGTGTTPSSTNGGPSFQLNASGKTYTYIAIG